MTKQKLCFEHGKNLKNQDNYICVAPKKCYLCKLELKLDKVLDLPEFNYLKINVEI